jgi:hypothetical protein
VQHCTNQDLNNRIEQDHWAGKQHHFPMHGFGSYVSVAQCFSAYNQVCHHFRALRHRPQDPRLCPNNEKPYINDGASYWPRGTPANRGEKGSRPR